MKTFLRGMTLIATLAIGSAAFAQVAYDNFGVGDTFVENTGWTIGGFTEQGIALQFDSLATGMLVGVRFASFFVTGSTDLQIQLLEDSSNELGSVMKTWNITKSDGAPGTRTNLTNSDSSIILTTGTTYWLEMTTTSGGHHAWNFNDQGDTGRLAFNLSGGSWNYLDGQQFGVFNVRLVPEPASMIALGLGVAALVARRRRKQSSAK